MKACPFCAEEIQDAAIVCKHCGRESASGGRITATTGAQPRVTAAGVFAKTLHCLAIGWTAYMLLALAAGIINSASAPATSSTAAAVGVTIGMGVLSLTWLIPVVGLEVIALATIALSGRQKNAGMNRKEWKRAFWVAFAPNAFVLCIGAYSVFYAML